jgi:hypothetical protein
MIEIVNDKNPLYNADRARLSAGIKTTTGLHGVTQIIIINNRGRFEFDGPAFD